MPEFPLITQRSLVQIQPPQPTVRKQSECGSLLVQGQEAVGFYATGDFRPLVPRFATQRGYGRIPVKVPRRRLCRVSLATRTPDSETLGR
jgi:hypothetical protein